MAELKIETVKNKKKVLVGVEAKKKKLAQEVVKSPKLTEVFCVGQPNILHSFQGSLYTTINIISV